MVQAQGSVEIDGYKLVNNRYLKMEMIEAGSFATIYKGQDCYVRPDGIDGTTHDSEWKGEPRLLSDEHIAMVQVVAKESPEIEYVRQDVEDQSEEKKQAI